MTSNPEPMVQQLQDDFQNLLAYVMGPDARARTAYTVECTLFRRRLALGAALVRWCFVTRAAVRPAEPVTAPDGTRLASHEQRPTTDSSVFGQVHFKRHYVTAPGQEGLCPFDAELSLPARCDSDLRREALEAEAHDPTCTVTQRQAVRRTVGYSRRHRPYMGSRQQSCENLR